MNHDPHKQADITHQIEWCKATALAWEARQETPGLLCLLNLFFAALLVINRHPIFAVVFGLLSIWHALFYFWVRARTRFYRYHQELWTRLLHDPDHANDYVDQMTHSLDEAQARAKHWWR